MRFGIIGTSVWQQNTPLQERLTIDRDARPVVLRKLKQQLGLDELIYLGTCNRVEILYAIPYASISAGRILHRLIDFFLSGRPCINFFPNDFYCYEGREALTHLFRTVSSLDSLVIGETQITGQFKEAWQEAQRLGLCGEVLSQLARESLLAARRVKRETEIGRGSLSMASLATESLMEQLGDISNPRVALTGAGSMTVKLAQYLRENTKAELLFVNRTLDKAKDLADRFGGAAAPLSEFSTAPGRLDAIFSATAAPTVVFDEATLKALTAENNRVTCIDLAVPRDFCSAFNWHHQICFFDIPRLKARGTKNLRRKFIETEKANRIINEEVNRYIAHRYELSLKPIFAESHRESLALARKALDDFFSRNLTNLNQNQLNDLQRLITSLISKSTFHPMHTLSSRLIDRDAPLALQPRLYPTREAV